MLNATLITMISVMLRHMWPILIRFSVIVISPNIYEYKQGYKAKHQYCQKEPAHNLALRDNEQQQSNNRHCASCNCVRPMAERRYKSEVNWMAYCFASV